MSAEQRGHAGFAQYLLKLVRPGLQSAFAADWVGRLRRDVDDHELERLRRRGQVVAQPRQLLGGQLVVSIVEDGEVGKAVVEAVVERPAAGKLGAATVQHVMIANRRVDWLTCRRHHPRKVVELAGVTLRRDVARHQHKSVLARHKVAHDLAEDRLILPAIAADDEAEARPADRHSFYIVHRLHRSWDGRDSWQRHQSRLKRQQRNGGWRGRRLVTAEQQDSQDDEE